MKKGTLNFAIQAFSTPFHFSKCFNILATARKLHVLRNLYKSSDSVEDDN